MRVNAGRVAQARRAVLSRERSNSLKIGEGSLYSCGFPQRTFPLNAVADDAICDRIELPLDQGWSFLSVLFHAAFEPRFFYRSQSDYSVIRIYCEFARMIAK
jgi:hypothetical protein